MDEPIPLGKLPVDLLKKLLENTPLQDPKVLLGPGIGLDCAVVDVGSTLLVLKSDPITFATESIGWYAVQISANDIATTGASPRWMLATILLPESRTTPQLVDRISLELTDACQEIGVTIIGGHTEITYGLDRPILVGTMIGEVSRDQLVTPRGACPGDRLLLTKGIPIEATAILANEFPERLMAGGEPAEPRAAALSQAEINEAQQFLYEPGISVLQDARIAAQAGRINAMHDPTEGGLFSALWELAEASGSSLAVTLESVPVPKLSSKICRVMGIDPFTAIASGALLLTSPEEDADKIRDALEAQGITCADIGQIIAKSPTPQVVNLSTPENHLVLRPARDAIGRLFED